MSAEPGTWLARRDPRAGPLTCLLLPSAARDKLDQVAEAVYQRMDQLYQGKMYFPGKGGKLGQGSPPAPTA